MGTSISRPTSHGGTARIGDRVYWRSRGIDVLEREGALTDAEKALIARAQGCAFEGAGTLRLAELRHMHKRSARGTLSSQEQQALPLLLRRLELQQAPMPLAAPQLDPVSVEDVGVRPDELDGSAEVAISALPEHLQRMAQSVHLALGAHEGDFLRIALQHVREARVRTSAPWRYPTEFEALHAAVAARVREQSAGVPLKASLAVPLPAVVRVALLHEHEVKLTLVIETSIVERRSLRDGKLHAEMHVQRTRRVEVDVEKDCEVVLLRHGGDQQVHCVGTSEPQLCGGKWQLELWRAGEREPSTSFDVQVPQMEAEGVDISSHVGCTLQGDGVVLQRKCTEVQRSPDGKHLSAAWTFVADGVECEAHVAIADDEVALLMPQVKLAPGRYAVDHFETLLALDVYPEGVLRVRGGDGPEISLVPCRGRLQGMVRHDGVLHCARFDLKRSRLEYKKEGGERIERHIVEDMRGVVPLPPLPTVTPHAHPRLVTAEAPAPIAPFSLPAVFGGDDKARGPGAELRFDDATLGQAFADAPSADGGASPPRRGLAHRVGSGAQWTSKHSALSFLQALRIYARARERGIHALRAPVSLGARAGHFVPEQLFVESWHALAKHVPRSAEGVEVLLRLAHAFRENPRDIQFHGKSLDAWTEDELT